MHTRTASSRRLLITMVAMIGLGITCTAYGESQGESVRFSMPRSHFEQPFVLHLVASTPGADLVYTIDGSKPRIHGDGSVRISVADKNDTAKATVQITTTTSVRAATIDAAGQTSATITHAYIHLPSVLNQGAPGGPFQRWGHSGPDWTVDPDIVGHKNVGDRLVKTDLLSIPALYISAPLESFWGEQGIYIEGEGVPIDCSIEMLNPSGDTEAPNREAGLAQAGTIQVTGGSSTHRWKTDKLSMRLKFHREAEFPVFNHTQHEPGQLPAKRFHTLVLDARLNESWNHSSGDQRKHGQYTRDQFVADLQKQSGGFAPSGRHVHLYLAGVYWGIYNLHERPDQHFAAHYLGGSHKDYDVVKHQADDVVHGDNAMFLKLGDLLDDPGISTADGFTKVVSLLDVESFADYMLLNYWAGNTDWSHQNWYASYNRKDPDGRWRFHSWDAEHTLKDIDENVIGKDDPASPTHFHRQLMKNDAYRVLFNKRVSDAFGPGGWLSADNTIEAYQSRLEEIDQAIRGESARWGDNRRRRPYTRSRDWSEERNRILEDYLPARESIVLQQLKQAGWID